MKKVILSLMLVIAMVLSLAACGTSSAVVEEPYEPVDYQLYPIPEDGYVGDTMPFATEDGTLEFYYLYDTNHNGQGYHPVYKYSTENLYEYTDHGEVLPFGNAGDADLAVGTGSVMQDQDGLYHLFYTGHNDSGNNGKGKECVMHATSTDRENWTKIPEDTFYSPDNYSKDDFRDPEVFWVDEEQCYWLLIAARENSLGGVVAKYTSTDLKNWEFCGSIYSPMQQYMLECPDLFKMGDKYYLTYSWDCVTYYAMSDSLNGPFEAPIDNILDANNFAFYAAKTAELNGDRYLCAWLGRAAMSSDCGQYGWAGNMLNHRLVQHEDGTLGICAPTTFDDYFTEDKPVKAVKKAGKVKIKKDAITLTAAEADPAIADMGTRPATMTLECDVTLNEDGCAGFAFGGTEKDPTYGAFCLDAGKNLLHYEGTDVDQLDVWDPVGYTKFDFSAASEHHVKLVCENDIVILYIDDTKALSTRALRSIDGAHIGFFASEGEAAFSNVTMKVPAAS